MNGSEVGDGRRYCQICTEELSKYVCPRCGIPYCSLKCYKNEEKHVKCSESFYKDCVMEGLRTQEVKDPEGAKKMTEALQRFHQQYDGMDQDDPEDGIDDEDLLDSDDDEPLEKRMHGIDLDDADEIWVNLTEEERAEFKKFTQDVDVNDVVPEWTPWWTVIPQRKLVQEITEEESALQIRNSMEKNKSNEDQPDILDPIPSMSSLTKIKPNDHVKVGLTNVIAAYVWTARLYNGEFVTYENVEEVAGAFVSLSSFLEKDTILSSFEHALADVSMNACRNPELFDGGPALQATLSQDVFNILSSHQTPSMVNPNQSQPPNRKHYVLAALTECYKLLVKAVALQNTKLKSNTMGISTSESKDLKNPLPRTRSKKSTKKLVEELVNEVPSTKASNLEAVSADNLEIGESDKKKFIFEKVFINPRSFCIEPKVFTKAKRKLHYLLAFANEYDVL